MSAVAAHAQWVNYPAAGIPRTSDGKPDLSGPTPRTRDGRPDFSGIWTTNATPPEEMERLFPFLKKFVVPGDDPRVFPSTSSASSRTSGRKMSRMRPEAAQLFKERLDSLVGIRQRRDACQPVFPWEICFRCRAGLFSSPTCW